MENEQNDKAIFELRDDLRRLTDMLENVFKNNSSDLSKEEKNKLRVDSIIDEYGCVVARLAFLQLLKIGTETL